MWRPNEPVEEDVSAPLGIDPQGKRRRSRRRAWRDGPRGIIEHVYVHDISSIVWEILRLRRCKVIIINSAFPSASQDLLKQLLRQPRPV